MLNFKGNSQGTSVNRYSNILYYELKNIELYRFVPNFPLSVHIRRSPSIVHKYIKLEDLAHACVQMQS